jgi:hypothetical protein
MSHRHHILDFSLREATDEDLDDMLGSLLVEHQNGFPSIEERCARAEALAIIAIEMLWRLRADGGKE